MGEEPFRLFSHFFYVSMFEFLSTCTIGIQGKRVGCHPHIVSLFQANSLTVLVGQPILSTKPDAAYTQNFKSVVSCGVNANTTRIQHVDTLSITEAA